MLRYVISHCTIGDSKKICQGRTGHKENWKTKTWNSTLSAFYRNLALVEPVSLKMSPQKVGIADQSIRTECNEEAKPPSSRSLEVLVSSRESRTMSVAWIWLEQVEEASAIARSVLMKPSRYTNRHHFCTLWRYKAALYYSLSASCMQLTWCTFAHWVREEWSVRTQRGPTRTKHGPTRTIHAQYVMHSMKHTHISCVYGFSDH